MLNSHIHQPGINQNHTLSNWDVLLAQDLENLEDELNEELTQGPKIDKARRRIKLENKLVEVNKLQLYPSP